MAGHHDARTTVERGGVWHRYGDTGEAVQVLVVASAPPVFESVVGQDPPLGYPAPVEIPESKDTCGDDTHGLGPEGGGDEEPGPRPSSRGRSAHHIDEVQQGHDDDARGGEQQGQRRCQGDR